MMNYFSKNLRYLRKMGNHNQDEIAVLFKKRPNTVGNWENQKSEPSLEELIKLGEFFHVNIQNLLHTDMQKELFQPGGSAAVSSSAGQNLEPVPVKDHLSGVAGDSGSDSFWIILRELRMINERLDLLSAGMQTATSKKNADKSYH
jgi:transcriptional regulator with XRE-family HTH domain